VIPLGCRGAGQRHGSPIWLECRQLPPRGRRGARPRSRGARHAQGCGDRIGLGIPSDPSREGRSGHERDRELTPRPVTRPVGLAGGCWSCGSTAWPTRRRRARLASDRSSGWTGTSTRASTVPQGVRARTGGHRGVQLGVADLGEPVAEPGRHHRRRPQGPGACPVDAAAVRVRQRRLLDPPADGGSGGAGQWGDRDERRLDGPEELHKLAGSLVNGGTLRWNSLDRMTDPLGYRVDVTIGEVDVGQLVLDPTALRPGPGKVTDPGSRTTPATRIPATPPSGTPRAGTSPRRPGTGRAATSSRRSGYPFSDRLGHQLRPGRHGGPGHGRPLRKSSSRAFTTSGASSCGQWPRPSRRS